MSKEFENKVLQFIGVAQEKFDSMDKRFESIDKRFDQMDKRFESIDKRFEKIDNILQDHSRQLNSLHESVAVIENKVLTEFPALLEAFTMHQELHEDYNQKIAYLSEKTEENSMRISVLEDQMKFIKSN